VLVKIKSLLKLKTDPWFALLAGRQVQHRVVTLLNRYLMLKYFFLLFIMIFPSISFAQIQLGDIKVESMSELFNKENNALWNAYGAFCKTDSEVWIPSLPSMIIDGEDQKLIILAFKKDLDQDSIRTVIVDQLNEQFGDYNESKILGMDKYLSLEWSIEENGVDYLFSMSTKKSVGSLNIIKGAEVANYR
jgi:hypothetical protein